jgi:CDP-glycerol glycerophosphotransferase (TagB/SpsB family)
MVGKSLALYTPYQCSVYTVPRMEFKRPSFFPYLWRYYSQGDLHKEMHLKHDPGIAGRQVVTGYPKLDTYLQPAPASCDAWPDSSGNRTRVIYAPHHSLPKEALKISTFHWNHDLLLDTAKRHKDTQWIYKPHARLKYVVEKNGVMSTSDYEQYVTTWREMENTSVYDEGEYFDIFKTSDVLITDCASFLGEYAPTGRPIIWLVSDVAAIKLNEIGAELSRGFYMVRSREEFVKVFDDVVVQRRDPLRELRMENVRKVLYLGRSSAAAVVDHLKSELGM